ncbi:MAG: glycoside hydrolase family 92 protein, partial [Duncaniella sp.]|nr:glycoside hydrolase family 92 protein [Duncaniella sp.]
TLFTRIKGEEHRTHKEVSRLLDKHFTTRPDGIPGNDDAGTMSAWAVFSMMGLYPDCPGVPEYAITVPTFDKITIHLNPDYYETDTLTIEKIPGERTKIVSGKKNIGYRISHSDLIKNGSITIHTSQYE